MINLCRPARVLLTFTFNVPRAESRLLNGVNCYT